MRKARFRHKKGTDKGGVRLRFGNQRYVIKCWAKTKQFSLAEYYPLLDCVKLKHSDFFYLIKILLPRMIRAKFLGVSYIQIHNATANYTYCFAVDEPGGVLHLIC